MQIDKEIFGKCICIDNKITSFDKEIESEFSLYLDSNRETHDLKIIITETSNIEITSNNPKSHFEYESGFGMKFGPIVINWNFERNPIECLICLKVKRKNPIRAFISKMLSMEYSLQKAIGQIIHEFVLFPLTFFFPDIAPIHGSSIIYNSKVIIFGGTGGVGKTSTLLALQKRKQIAFYSDDLLILSKTSAFPNYAFPKIYAYNVINDKELEAKILKDDTIASQFHWHFWKKTDSAKVRRRIHPLSLFEKPEENSYQISDYLIFNRCNKKNIEIHKIDSKIASNITLEIIKTEFHRINNHFYWHNFNRLIQGKNTFFSLPDIFNRWLSIYKAVLKNKTIYIIDVPIKIDHSFFKHRLLEIIESEILK